MRNQTQLPRFEDLPDVLTPQDLRAFLPIRCNAIYDALNSQMLNWAVRMEYVSRNVATLLTTDDIPKVARPEIQILNELELRRLPSTSTKPTSRAQKRGTLNSQPWFYPAVAFAAYTGARRGEVLAVRWSDIVFDRQGVTIQKSLTETKNGLLFKSPKNGRSREVSAAGETRCYPSRASSPTEGRT